LTEFEERSSGVKLLHDRRENETGYNLDRGSETAFVGIVTCTNRPEIVSEDGGRSDERFQ